jgi:hypothetical protein
VCQRFTVANASVTSSPAAIAADATNLYWLDNGLNAVLQVPVASPGSTPTTLATLSTPVYFQGIVVTGSTLVFTTDDQNIIVTNALWTAKVGVANQSLTPLDNFNRFGPVEGGPAINSAGTIAYIMIDPQDTNGNYTLATQLEACPLATANSCSLLTTVMSNEVTAPAISGGFLFFGDGRNNVIERYTLPSGPLVNPWISGVLQPGTFTGDSSRIYWSFNGDGTFSTTTVSGALASAATGSGQPLGFGNITGGSSGLASDGKFGYFAWVNYNGTTPTGAVQYAAVTGGAVQTLYTGTAPSHVIAANGGIYWIDGANIYGQRFP